MKLEQQVANIEPSMKLKELGVKQESLFYWVMFSSESGGNANYFIVSAEEYQNSDSYIFPVSAFTVAELGEMMSSAKLPSGSIEIDFGCHHTGSFTNFWGNYKYDSHGSHIVSSDNEADARAKMLIYLIENKLINF